MKAVFYRHNPALATRVQQAQPDFVREFPAEMSIEDIRRALRTAVRPLLERVQAEENYHDWSVHVDGTVMAAGIYDLLWHPCDICLIQQDSATAYDWYAAQVAEAAKKADRSGGPLVVIVRDKIADHNSENRLPADDQEDGLREMEEEYVTVKRWVERLQEHGLKLRVVTARWLESTLQHEARYGGLTVREAAVVCDHHNGDTLRRLIEDRQGIWFNAFPRCSDDGFLAS